MNVHSPCPMIIDFPAQRVKLSELQPFVHRQITPDSVLIDERCTVQDYDAAPSRKGRLTGIAL